MKKYLMTVLFGILLVSAAGCGSAQTREGGSEPEAADAAETADAAQEAGAAETGAAETADSGAGEETISSLTAEAESAYHSVLYNVYFNHLFPDGKDYGFLEGADISENEFAVCDVDQDGSLELLISYTTTDEAGRVELVYDFISAFDAVREEFVERPGLVFYENGYVKAYWSENQGLAGEAFQPYVLYQYNAESDAYTAAARVDAWEQAVSETNADGTAFPENVDADSAGIVYDVIPDGGEAGEPVSQAEYAEWEASWMGDAEELVIPWMKLTEENMDLLKK